MAVPDLRRLSLNPDQLTQLLIQAAQDPSVTREHERAALARVSPAKAAELAMLGLIIILERSTKPRAEDLVECITYQAQFVPKALPFILNRLHEIYTQFTVANISFDDVLAAEIAAVPLVDPVPLTIEGYCLERFLKIKKSPAFKGNIMAVAARFEDALKSSKYGAAAASAFKDKVASSRSPSHSPKKEGKESKAGWEEVIGRMQAVATQRGTTTVAQFQEFYDAYAAQQTKEILKGWKQKIAESVADPVATIQTEMDALKGGSVSVLYCLGPALQQEQAALGLTVEALLTLQLHLISLLAAREGASQITTYAAYRVSCLNGLFPTPQKRREFVDKIVVQLETSAAQIAFAEALKKWAPSHPPKSTPSPSPAAPPSPPKASSLPGTLEARYGRVQQVFGKPTPAAVGELFHDLFSRSRAFPLSLEHYVVSAFLHGKVSEADDIPLLFPVANKMVQDQAAYFAHHNSPPPSPSKSVRGSGKLETAWYVGGVKNWQKFIENGQSWKERANDPVGLSVLSSPPSDEALKEGAVAAIRHCDTFAVMHFKAPANYFHATSLSGGERRLQGRKKEEMTLMPLEAAMQQRMERVISQLLEANLAQLQATNPEIHRSIQKKVEPPPALLPPAPRSLPAPAPLPPREPQVPPSHNRRLFAAVAVSSLGLLLLWRLRALQRAWKMVQRVFSRERLDVHVVNEVLTPHKKIVIYD
jgi:hypothetical protein